MFGIYLERRMNVTIVKRVGMGDCDCGGNDIKAQRSDMVDFLSARRTRTCEQSTVLRDCTLWRHLCLCNTQSKRQGKGYCV